jgi:hypothetical protein
MPRVGERNEWPGDSFIRLKNQSAPLPGGRGAKPSGTGATIMGTGDDLSFLTFCFTCGDRQASDLPIFGHS